MSNRNSRRFNRQEQDQLNPARGAIKARSLALIAYLVALVLPCIAGAVEPQFVGGLFPVGDSPGALATVDLDGDNIPDLIVTNFDTDELLVLIGNGDGTFQPEDAFPAGSRPAGIATADLNGDGFLDVVTSELSSNNVSALLGNGDGTFAAPITGTADIAISSLDLGDFNGDTFPDLVTTRTTSLVILQLGNGDGTFQAPVSHPLSVVTRSVALADLNGDTFLDIVVTNRSTASDDDLGVMLGKGDGTFQAPVYYVAGARTSSVSVADVNGDTVLDLVYTDSISTDQSVGVLLGNGNGTFQPAAFHVAVGFDASSVRAVDLDGDTVLDLVISTFFVFGRGLLVALGNGDGSFQEAVRIASGRTSAPAVADIDGDLIPDLIGNVGPSDALHLMIGNGDGSFQVAAHYPVGDDPQTLAEADLNGDSVTDLVTANDNSEDVTVMLGNGDGSFQAPVAYPVPNAISAAIADLNGDTFPDIVSGGLFEVVNVLLGNGDGTFQAAVAHAAGASSHRIAVADLDGDSFFDVVSAGGAFSTIGMSVLLGNGDATFQGAITIPATSAGEALSLGDVDRECFDDRRRRSTLDRRRRWRCDSRPRDRQ